ncbi:uncharacterized protein K452DRAFT_310816 [Aplosporella prunicola CBS 121167]|uniref:Uncharacterized protein n=1 Tax=Aplosporella prunicola CBS 121167 TaxID=1176127 RepID=A0A6A6BA61_9PEZI|nr:uncharacterized protein K452DRAFT_310816 [Aplosporella prunicola CBS 121167]KAF2139391.1 hypothetical protein K452DRAFT_310816 [Aplosporella prunicola CBS 121167]
MSKPTPPTQTRTQDQPTKNHYCKPSKRTTSPENAPQNTPPQHLPQPWNRAQKHQRQRGNAIEDGPPMRRKQLCRRALAHQHHDVGAQDHEHQARGAEVVDHCARCGSMHYAECVELAFEVWHFWCCCLFCGGGCKFDRVFIVWLSSVSGQRA